MQNRRHFIRNLSLIIPATAVGGYAAKAATFAEENRPDNLLLLKVRYAMLAMQRASWEQGTTIQAMIECREFEMLRFLVDEAILRQSPDGRTCMLGSGHNVTDPVAAGCGILKAYELFGDEKYKSAADRLYDYCKNKAPRDPNGTLYHLNDSKQLWSDSIYMLPPFLAAYQDSEECMKQLRGYRTRLWQPKKKLYSHRWSDDENRFLTENSWGGGNGWAAASFAIVYELLPKAQQTYREEVASYLVELLEGLLPNMRPDGLFHDIVDNPQTYVETNLSQMTAFAIYKAVKNGAIDSSYLQAAKQMQQGALSKVDQYGYVQGAAGSPMFNSPGTSTEAQAFLLMMVAAESNVL
ncbi:unsaturated rhamnogalacturonyl hydrolase [Parabacteroides sp. PF5-5]|uniref:glycoside hydrolase family 88 protein n=1 Tax=unclassified Parabacteroides TaxID=2649774 RepID=UPI002475BC66|nr:MULTISPECIES: glycoside hydrolase family 88 protein [unclassified Parabacteroides]MDH6305165.1 unsaturated rhamnogalacturonyl hydrolase [Parabacteroides sp. PH5-39]MDH6316515.1 unsaturated rhamnogalacturonyl hydrolase [Parabacteroides sp. PF5-13]MDH6320025.1 unsaturated rhamnogalacturonyl hydrolase [Parabacteroides sp. PH5-13]MDH6323742.1 unsaturated rhamnogalacturonyl hydrolase [Parabacteroides sp. PH5-8]MDH6327702.1 unsaturated rhamnogalacturonyl hydrolase [Parabacteroides sp. PH5-41]